MADFSSDIRFKKYARLIVEGGANLHKGQEVVLSAPIECAEFARLVARQCYLSGASDVVLHYADARFNRLRIDLAPEEALEFVPPWKADSANYYVDRDAVYLSISCPDPEVMAGSDSKRSAVLSKAIQMAQRPSSDARMANIRPWCIAAASADGWASKVFPDLPAEEAVGALWEAIFSVMNVTRDNDPVADWTVHQEALKARARRMTEEGIKTLHYRSGRGTDLTVDLPDKAIWVGGGDVDRGGKPFSPNMPTEEIFTAPHRATANGTLVSAMPLNYQGNLVDDFRFTFRNGRVVDFDARVGRDVLAEILATDEGASYLGEVALVPYSSPIRRSGILFYSTLYDENASCHFAVGEGYPCVEGADRMTPAQLRAAGVNDSLTHVDFMVGTEDMAITATTRDGRTLPLMRNGEWVL